MRSPTQLLCLVICIALSAPLFAAATDAGPRTYAVISLIGDKINVVGHESTTGSGMDRNRQASIAVGNHALDDTAVLAAVNAIARLDKDAKAFGLTSTNSTLYDMQNELFDRPDLSASLSAALKSALRGQNATHLILITKHRGEASLRLRDQSVGSGKIEGVGFYLDAGLKTRRLDTGATGQGFLAPFAYVKVSLIDVDSMTVIRARTEEETATVSTPSAEGSVQPADALSGAQKTAALQSMIGRAVVRAMPEVLGVKRD